MGSIFGGVHNFFHSGTWAAIRALALVFVLVFWLATVYWVWKDARRRIADPLVVALATVVGVIPFVGPLIYMLFRPPEYLDDVRERELEIKAIERRLLGGTESQCSVCGAGVEPEFLVCPVCTHRLRQACASCERPIEPAWQVCPYCETPVGEERPVRLRGSTKADGAAAAPAPAPPRTQQRRRSGTSR